MKSVSKMQKLLLLVVFALSYVGAREESFPNSTRSSFSSFRHFPGILKSSIISEAEFRLFEQGLNSVRNFKCKNDLNMTLWGIVKGLSWAVTMYDSSVKVPTGIESGSIYQFGNFDECVNSGAHDGDQQRRPQITPKYCLADITVEGIAVRSSSTRNPQPHNSTVIHWGVCLPSSCLSDDIENFLRTALNHEVHVDEDMCHVNKPFEATKGMVVYGCFILCFLMMTFFSTMYHFYMIQRKDPLKKNKSENFEMIMKSFSIIENMKKLFQKSHDHMGLNAINGIKAIFMFLVVIGHSCVFIISGPVLNSDFFAKISKQVQNGFLLNSILYVDTFLLLSGFLFCRILLVELERRRGKINVLILYIFRYIRLTPAYFAVIAFYMTWFPKIGSGPLWNKRIGLEQGRCLNSWWTNLLYINNYVGTDHLCMFQSWYLAVDTQLYILAPIAIYALWKSRKIGVWFLSAIAVVTGVLPFIITYVKELDPTLLVYADELEDISTNKFFANTYIKTHFRATGYVAGLLSGFLVHYIQERQLEIPRKVVASMWTLSIILGITSMFAVSVFYNTAYTALESAAYAGLHRLGWSIATGWLLIALITGHAGFLQSILSSRFFAPLSRLTYCAYLTNGLVELHQLASLRTPVKLDYVNLVGIPISHSVYTFISSVVLCLLFESPIHGIEKILLKKESQRRHTQQKAENQTPSTSEEAA